MNRRRSLAGIPWESIAGAIGTPFILWAVVHSIRNRTLEDFVRYSGLIALPMLLVGLVVLLIVWKSEGLRRPSGEEVRSLVISPIALTFICAIYYALGAAVKDAYVWLRTPQAELTQSTPISGEMAVVLTILFALLLGFVLFYWRLRLRSLYGLTEALIGLAVAGQQASVAQGSPFEDPKFYLVVLTAGVYLIVRGLDNIHQGIFKDPKDPIADALLSRFREMAARARSKILELD